MLIKESNVFSFPGGLSGLDNAGRIPMQRLWKMLCMGRIMMKMKLKLLLQKPGAVLQHRNAKQLLTWLSLRPRSTIGHNLRTLERCTLFVCSQDLNSRVENFRHLNYHKYQSWLYIYIELNLESFIRKLRRCRPFLGASFMDRRPAFSLTTGRPWESPSRGKPHHRVWSFWNITNKHNLKPFPMQLQRLWFSIGPYVIKWLLFCTFCSWRSLLQSSSKSIWERINYLWQARRTFFWIVFSHI